MTNNGSGDAFDVQVTDTMPTAITIVEYTSSSSGVAVSPSMPGGTSFTWDISELLV
ncbi:MAG: DUF11 domain-containing protein [Candidatus Peribacteria bacterium]|nr:MAG: DUF11 domain-containing protein [Candidatus Peribacteria bacterium]